MTVKRRPALQPVQSDWFRALPPSWDHKPIKHCFTLVTTAAGARERPIALENVEGWTGRLVPTESDFQGDGVSFQRGDLLFGKLRPYLAKVYRADAAGEAVGDFFVLRPAHLLSDRFAQYVLLARDFIDAVGSSTYGAKMPRVGWDFFRELRMPLPEMQEQDMVADYLDRETARIDALIEKKSRFIELLREKRQAAITQAVMRGIDPAVPMKHSGVDWIGAVPAHWTVKPLKYCVGYQEGPGIMAADFEAEGVPLLRISCVQGRWATLDGCNYLSPEKVARQWQHFLLSVGDLLISGSASMGVVTEVGDDAAGAVAYTGLIRLRGRHGAMLKPFVRWLVVSDLFLTQIELLKAGSTIQHFGPTHLDQMLALQPPVDEQARIAEHIDKVTQRIDAIVAHTQRSIDLLRERRAALITAAVTGQIDVRADTPAEETEPA